MEEALREIETRSGVINFQETNDTDLVPQLRFITKNIDQEGHFAGYPSYWSYVGQQVDVQDLNLAVKDMDKGTALHLLFHALGFWHESTRWDCDDYIDMVWENVWPGFEFYFAKRVIVDNLESPYDYGSLMHDYADDFSTGSGAMRGPPGVTLGQLDGPTDLDILKLRLLYQCDSGPRNMSDYLESLCTEDCKCWEQAMGCQSQDEACQGDLICRSNQCVAGSHEELPFLVLAILVVGGLFAVCGCRMWYSRRRDYESL